MDVVEGRAWASGRAACLGLYAKYVLHLMQSICRIHHSPRAKCDGVDAVDWYEYQAASKTVFSRKSLRMNFQAPNRRSQSRI